MSKKTKQGLEQPITLATISDLLDQKLEEKLEEKLDQKLAPLIKTVNELKTDVSGLKTDVAGLKTDVAGLKTDVADLKEDMCIVKDFLTTEVMTKADGRAIMSIVNQHSKEIKELQAIAHF